MADYTAPLADIRFTLRHVAGLDEIAGLPGYEHADGDTVFGALDEAARLMSEVVAPTNRPGDEVGCSIDADGNVTTPPGFADAYSTYVEAGWPAVAAPAEHGGHGFPFVVGVAVQEMLTSANMSLSLCPMLTHGAIEALEEHGSDEQQAAYLPKLVTGEWSGTMVLTEPHAGSDVGALRTRAVPADDGTYRLFGQKIYITFGEHDLTENIIHMVLARTPDAPAGTKGISLFIVPKFVLDDDGGPGDRNDVRCVSIEHKLGIHGSPTCVLSFGDAGDGAAGYLVGEEQEGMKAMFTMMNNARLLVGIEGLAVAERALQQSVEFAQDRRQGRAAGGSKSEQSLIIEHPDVRRMLMTMKADTEAMRALLYYAAGQVDRAKRHPDAEQRERAAELVRLLTPIGKAWPTDLAVEDTSIGIQVHGGMGYVEETGIAQHFRDSRIASIYEGTNGIQAIDLAGRVLPMRGGDVVRELIADIREDVAALAEMEDDCRVVAAHLDGAVAAFENATEWLLAAEDPGDVLAGATPYLAMAGMLMGGWLLGRSALVASKALSKSPDDFLRAKITTARFFAEQRLPQVAGLLPAATAGAATLYAIEPKHL